MADERQRDFGEQPVAALMQEHGLSSKDLVQRSTQQLTHKMVARACRGRWLTENTRGKVLDALNSAVENQYSLDDLFNY